MTYKHKKFKIINIIKCCKEQEKDTNKNIKSKINLYY